MTPAERVEAAAKATDKIADAYATIQASMQHGFTVNGYGVVRDQFAVQQPLLTAIEQARTALEVIQKTEWPREIDYDAM